MTEVEHETLISRLRTVAQGLGSKKQFASAAEVDRGADLILTLIQEKREARSKALEEAAKLADEAYADCAKFSDKCETDAMKGMFHNFASASKTLGDAIRALTPGDTP